MDPLVDRINQLTHKAKQEGLTAAEQAERDELRKKYLAAVRRNVQLQLENVRLVDEQGNQTPLRKKQL